MAKTERCQRNNLTFSISNTSITFLSLILALLFCNHAKISIKCKATKWEYSIPACPCYHLQTLVKVHQQWFSSPLCITTDTATSVHTTGTYMANVNANDQSGRCRCVITFNEAIYMPDLYCKIA